MSTLITIGVIIFIIYLLYRVVFVRREPIVQDAEIAFKSKQIYSDPNNPELYSKRGLKFLHRAGNYLFQRDEENANNYYQKALEDFNKAIELNSRYAEAYYYKGIILWTMKDDIEAYYTLVEAEKLGYRKATQFIIDQGMRSNDLPSKHDYTQTKPEINHKEESSHRFVCKYCQCEIELCESEMKLEKYHCPVCKNIIVYKNI